MVIVILTRYDLRDEFAMADEAFALSPISARAELPREQDYDAIREAFMETARGRWFLGEFGKRNRNADTSMVLDAVARIEATIAAHSAHKQAPANELPDALVLIRGLLSDAKDGAARTMSGPDAEQALAAVDKATRIIREIAWTLREYGTDARICDLLDAQVKAIEASHQQTIAPNKRDAVLATFDLLIRRIGELGGSGAAPPSSDSETATLSSSVADNDAAAAMAAPAEAAAPPFETAAEAVAQAAVEVAATVMPDEIGAMTADATTHDTQALDTPELPSPSSETSMAEMTTSAAEVAPAILPEQDVVAAADAETTSIDDEIAQDLAVLDAIALEMAEPEIADSGVAKSPQMVEPDIVEPPQIIEPDMVEPPQIVEPDMVEPDIVERVPETAIAPEQEPEPKMPSEPSLGAALIANGILSRSSAAHDALAPIRRMTQAERIAFFS
jgi:hypothetical protein